MMAVANITAERASAPKAANAWLETLEAKVMIEFSFSD
jgi:hypothetical protein